MKDLGNHVSLGVIAPTGAGKTIIIQEIIERTLKEKGSGYNCIVVSHLSALQDQTFTRFENQCRYRVGRFQGQKILPSVFDRVIITTMQTLRREQSHRYLHRRALHQKTAIIFIDEAQLYGSKSYEMIEEAYPDAKIIGLSASPYRGNKYSFNQFDKVSYAISLQELIDEKFLVPPVLHQINLAGMDIPERIAHCAQIYDKHCNGKGALFYWNTKEVASNANAAFFAAGLKTAYITDDTPKTRKDKILRDFDSGKIKIIHNVNILSAGFDSPNVYSVFLPMGTSSPVNYIQRIGRGLRLDGDRKTHCDVFIYGEAPSIKRGLYQKLHRIAMKTKDDPFYGDRGDAYEQLDWLEAEETPNKEKLKFTREVVAACEHMRTLGFENLSHMIRFKKFPKRFLRSLVTAQARQDEVDKANPSEGQIKYLKAKGFEEAQIKGLRKAEATALVSAIQSSLNKKFVVKSGMYENYHISEVPGPYFGALKKKFPHHPIFKMFNAWCRAGRPNQ
jgi:superfamily II DNA/RNA helicase